MKERHDADGNQGRPLLSSVEGQARQGKRRRDLPNQYPTIVANGQAVSGEDPQAKLKLRQVNARFMAEVRRRAENYRLDGLIELHRIATMPLGDAAENRVKLMAAQVLVELHLGGDEVSSNGFDLAALQDAYHAHAVRIRQVREKTVTYVEEASPAAVRVEDTAAPAVAT